MSNQKFEELRRKAEERLLAKAYRIENAERADLEKLAYELEVHQVELEIQNEELRLARAESDEVKDRYINLFDFAPIGYFGLDEENRIVEVNLAGCQLLKIDRSKLLKQSFTKFIDLDESENFYLFRRKVLESGARQSGELQMKAEDGTVFYAQLESAKIGEGKLRLAVIDNTERKNLERELIESKESLEVKVTERSAALIIANMRLKTLAAQLSLAEAHERRRIANEIHDGIGQELALSNIQLSRLINNLSFHTLPNSSLIVERLKEIQDSIIKIGKHTHDFVFEISPPSLYSLGLSAALTDLARRIQLKHNIPTSFEDDKQEKALGEDVKILVFQMVNELVVNIIKHAHAKTIKLSSAKVGKSIQVVVEDDGVGFDTASLEKKERQGFGLFSIKERLSIVGGQIEIASRPGSTKVTIRAPLNEIKPK